MSNQLPHTSESKQREVYELADALLSREITPEEAERLGKLVCGDPEARRHYVRFMHDSATLCQWGREATDSTQWAGFRGQGLGVPVGAAVELPHRPDMEFPSPQPPAPNPEAPFPPIILDLSPASRYPLTTSHFSVGSWAFSYMVATVIVGAIILGAWAYKITHRYEIADNSRGQTAPGESVQANPEMVFVGRVTGMVDCKWADPSTEPFAGAYIPLGRKYALASGLMEITYDSGAKVILQGPCTYEVESGGGGGGGGGYLALGKLTARVEKKGSGVRGQGSEKANPQISNPQSLIPNLFVVRTPTAVVTDLGTEFGVKVGEDGATEFHVLQGEVVGQSWSVQDRVAKTIHVKAGYAVRIEPDRGEFVSVALTSKNFVRSLRMPSKGGVDAAYIRAVLADKPLAYWPLNEAAYSRRFNDRSDSGFHGWAMGNVRAGQPGPLPGQSRALELDGNGYIDVGRQQQFAFEGDFTVEAWLWIGDGAGGDIERIISADAAESAPCTAGWSLGYVPEAVPTHLNKPPCLMFTLYGIRDFVFETFEPPKQQWIHVAVVCEAGKAARLFVNGQRQASLIEAQMPKVQPLWVAIGRTAGGAHPFNGRLAHIAVYPHVLPEERIQSHYQHVGAPENALRQEAEPR